MASCPGCEHDIGDDFGLVTCQNCGLSSFLCLDGTIDEAASEQSSQLNETKPEEPNHNNAEENTFNGLSESAEIQNGELESYGDEELLEDPVTAQSSDQELIVSEEYEESGSDLEPLIHEVSLDSEHNESLVNEQEYDDLGFTEQDNNLESKSAEDDIVASDDYNIQSEEMNTESAMADIANFGNSEVSEAKSGVYRYKITVSDVDTKELKQNVYYALEDSRFLWNIDELINSIKQGILILEDLNTVKASIIVGRLKSLNVTLKWEQYEIHKI